MSTEPGAAQADVLNERSPTAGLQSLLKLGQNEKSPEAKCSKFFFVGESYLLLGDRNNGLRIMALCFPPSYDTFYPWIMKAETVNWTR